MNEEIENRYFLQYNVKKQTHFLSRILLIKMKRNRSVLVNNDIFLSILSARPLELAICKIWPILAPCRNFNKFGVFLSIPVDSDQVL